MCGYPHHCCRHQSEPESLVLETTSSGGGFILPGWITEDKHNAPGNQYNREDILFCFRYMTGTSLTHSRKSSSSQLPTGPAKSAIYSISAQRVVAAGVATGRLILNVPDWFSEGHLPDGPVWLVSARCRKCQARCFHGERNCVRDSWVPLTGEKLGVGMSGPLWRKRRSTAYSNAFHV